MRFFQTRLLIASGVFWCAFMGAGIALRPAQNNAPAEPELFAMPTVMRTLAPAPELSFEERWQVPTPRFAASIVDQDEPAEPNPDPRGARPVEKHRDTVCGTRVRRHVPESCGRSGVEFSNNRQIEH